jgi:Na+-driven multidrug efflux pump
MLLLILLPARAAMAARAGSSISSSIGAVDVSALSMASIDASMATAAATASASIAAHQIGIQLWLLCSFFCDSLAAASQGLVADALGRQDRDDVLDVSQTIFAYSLILGLVLAALLQIGSSTHVLVNLFTNDVATQAALSRILPLIILAQPLNALVFAADGVLQGAAEFPFQAKAMIVSGVTAVATFWALDVTAVLPPLPLDNAILNDRLVHVWLALIALQTMRGLTSLWKLVDRDGPINLLSRKGS